MIRVLDKATIDKIAAGEVIEAVIPDRTENS